MRLSLKLYFPLTFNEKGIKTCQYLSMDITSFNTNHIATDKNFQVVDITKIHCIKITQKGVVNVLPPDLWSH